jgi:uncharacterized protein
LVHISHLADVFVKAPRDVVKTGEMDKVKVLEIDVARKRIALSMKRNTDESTIKPKPKKQKAGQKNNHQNPGQQPANQGTMANAFAKALKK